MSIFLQPETSFVAGPFLGIRPWNGGGGRSTNKNHTVLSVERCLVWYRTQQKILFLFQEKKNLFQELFS